MVSILVTGGAGYIGSHVCKGVSSAGYLPVTYDNLCRGHRDFVRWGPFEYGDVRDGTRLDQVIAVHRPSAAIHLAALAYVAESVADPLAYCDNNIFGSLAVNPGTCSRWDRSYRVFQYLCGIWIATRNADQRSDGAETH